jgi:hypothetical protein
VGGSGQGNSACQESRRRALAASPQNSSAGALNTEFFEFEIEFDFFFPLVAQSMQQLREHAKISEQRAVEAEQRLAEERESNAVRSFAQIGCDLFLCLLLFRTCIFIFSFLCGVSFCYKAVSFVSVLKSFF